MIKVKFCSFWCSEEELLVRCNRCTPNQDYKWKDLELTISDDYDFICILDYPGKTRYKASKAIYFSGEGSRMRNKFRIKKHFDPRQLGFYRVYDPDIYRTISTWYIDLNYKQLLTPALFLKHKELSTIISDNHSRPGHKDRLRFLKWLERIPLLDHYGRDSRGAFSNRATYRGSLASKEDGLLSYKYHFNAENEYIPNYFTEKILDPIFCETLCFYAGCPNLEKFVNPESFVRVDLNEPDNALEIIEKSIRERLWEKRLPVIRSEKHKFMTEENLLNVVWKIVHQKI